jgi:hypothetical protein
MSAFTLLIFTLPIFTIYFFIAFIDILTLQYHRNIKISNYGEVSNKFNFYVKVNIFKTHFSKKKYIYHLLQSKVNADPYFKYLKKFQGIELQ